MNPKALLINPPLSLKHRYGLFAEAGGMEVPLGLCYLAAALRKAGVPAGIIDAQALRLEEDDILKQVCALRPQYVGFTAATPQVLRASTLAGRIKEALPGVVTIVGGNHVSAVPHMTLEEHPSFDIGVKGEGEESLCEAVLSLEQGNTLSGVKGVVFRQEGKVVYTGPRQRITDLDALAPPAFDLLPALAEHYYLPIQHVFQSPAISLATSRGCTGTCTFCDRSVFGNTLAFHSAEYIIALLASLKARYGIRHVMFQDDNFFLFKKRLVDFCRLLAKARLGITWSASARADTVDAQTLRIARSGGCQQVSFGIENAHQPILDMYHKGMRIETVAKALQETRKAGMRTKGFIMFGNPLETKESIQKTVDFSLSQPLDDISITFFTPYPGAELWEGAAGFGKASRDLDSSTCFSPVFVPAGMTRASLEESRKRALREFYLRPGPALSYASRMGFRGYPGRFLKSASGVLRYLCSPRASSGCIISADDLGLLPEVNAGIMEAVSSGIVTGVSLMANGEAFEDAAARLSLHPGLDVGMHLTLVEQKPVLPGEQVPSLVGRGGYLHCGYAAFLARYFLGRINMREVEQELAAQLAKAGGKGISLTHVDSHQHLHMLPGILPVVIKCAKNSNIRRIRYPYTPLRMLMLQSYANPVRALGCLFLNALCLFQRGLLRREGMYHPSCYCNASNAGAHFRQAARQFCAMRKHGPKEISFHPATHPAGLRLLYPGLKYQWDKEQAYLSGADAAADLLAAGGERSSFHDLGQEGAG